MSYFIMIVAPRSEINLFFLFLPDVLLLVIFLNSTIQFVSWSLCLVFFLPKHKEEEGKGNWTGPTFDISDFSPMH